MKSRTEKEEYKKPVIPLLNFNPLGISPQMPKMSGLPQVGMDHKYFFKPQKEEDGSSEDDGIDDDDEINMPAISQKSVSLAAEKDVGVFEQVGQKDKVGEQ